MTRKEIIKAGKVKVRNTPLLYSAYIKTFKSVFGYEPQCPTCGSSQGQKDWSDFNRFVETNIISKSKNINTMENNKKTFTLRDKSLLYSYDYLHENGRILRARSYGHSMTEDFAKKYLENASGNADLEERKNKFLILPSVPAEEKQEFLHVPAEEKQEFLHVPVEENFFATLTKVQLKKVLVDFGIEENDFKYLNKSDLIALAEVKSIEFNEQ